MRTKKKMTATQVAVVTNSYMSPHGTRWTASPRLTTPTMSAASPTAVRQTASRTHSPIRPASRPALAAAAAGGVAGGPAGVTGGPAGAAGPAAGERGAA